MSAQPRSTQQLAGKKFLVLGGTSGIGAGVVSAILEENGIVIIASSTESKVQAAIKKFSDPAIQYNADPKRISGYTVNLKGEGMEKSLEELFAKVGRIDGLIHTAGDALAPKPIEEQDYATIINSGQVRFISAVLTAKVASKYINPGGSLILTTGSVSVKPVPMWSTMNGWAAGISGLVRGFALDLHEKKIRVNGVSPGAVNTELWDGFGDQKEMYMEKFSQGMLTKHVALPHEIAQSYIYLLKDTNTSGETIYSDGGVRML